ncbi:MAG TPA: S8 family serine peptidase, partial [Candidatus Eremiobacteraceae bacterium]|nr:S8 family serine peptidase [Candidatus Eremiobacteraceae bacterium]
MPRASAGPLFAGLCALFAAGCLAACGSGGGGSTTPAPTPTPTPSSTPACSAEITHALPGLTMRMPVRETERILPGLVAVRFATGDMSRLSAAITMVRGIANTPMNVDHAATITLRPGVDSRAAAAQLRSLPGVVAAGPVILRSKLQAEVIPNNPDFGSVPYSAPDPAANNPFIQWDMYAVSMPQAWALPTGFGSDTVKLAIIDTGYDLTNPDLVPNPDTRVAASVVYDLGDGQQDIGASVQDHDGHGTDVTGIAAADTSSAATPTQYVAGVDGEVTLLEARVFPNPTDADPCPGASTEDVAAAIHWAIGEGANVISMSLGSSTPDETYEEPAVADAIGAGVTVVAAAGNSDQPALDYPAADPNVIAVGASGYDDDATARSYPGSGANGDFEDVASYSNYVINPAANLYYLVAPGGDPDAAQGNCAQTACVDFLQWITNLYSSTASQDAGDLILIAGTSMATPHVAGTAALMLAKDPTASPALIAQTITSTTDQLNNAGCADCNEQGHG